MKIGPRLKGQPWTPQEDAQLLALLESKMDRPSIARKLKRTVVAIATPTEDSEGDRCEGAEMS
jgi:hypothetical protein